MNIKVLIGLIILLNQTVFMLHGQTRDISEGKEFEALITLEGKLITDFRYSELHSVRNKRIKASQVINGKKKWGIIDHKGKEIVPCIYDFITVYHGGFSEVILDDKWGIIDTLGNEIVPCIYPMIYGFKNNLLFAEINAKVKVLDIKQNKTIISFRDDSYFMEYFNDNVLIIKKFDQNTHEFRPALMNVKRNEFITPYIYDDLNNFFFKSENFIQAKINGKCGLFNAIGREIIPCIYDDVQIIISRYDYESEHKEYYIKVKKDYKWGVFDLKGDMLIDFKYDEIISSLDTYPYLTVRLDSKIGIVDNEDHVIVPFIYDKINDFHDSILIGIKGYKYGAVHLNGKEIIPFEYESLYTPYMGNYPAKRNGKFGIISENLENVVPFDYESLSFINGQLIAKKDGKFGIINLENKEIVAFLENYIFIYGITKDLLCVRKVIFD